MKRSFTYFLVLFFMVLRIVVLTSCANIIPPGGGPIDSLPPRLVITSPKDSAIGVSVLPQNINLMFDEYVTLDNVLSALIVSPTLPHSPLVDSKLRNVTIRIKDTLEPNTTYSFNFGNAIKDVNEGNIARGITYIFSTGRTIDYNTYGGKILLAETGKVDSSMIVVLHKNLSDTAIIKLRPRYYTRLNGSGEFMFHNLPAGDFSVYAIGKESFAKKYDDSTLLFAFRNSPVSISANTITDTLYAFEAFKRKTGTSSLSPVKLPGNADKRLRYTVDLDAGKQDLLNDMNLLFTRKLTSFDSTKFVLYDTNYNRIQGYRVSLDTNKTKVTLKYKWKEATPFSLLIAKDAVADSGGNTLSKADTIRFFTKKETDYGSIRLRFTNLTLSKNPVLQFVQNDKIIESFPLTQAELSRKMYRPGTYDLRILFDTNKNGIWDTGRFPANKQQPEIVFLIPKQLVIRSNWDNEVTIEL